MRLILRRGDLFWGDGDLFWPIHLVLSLLPSAFRNAISFNCQEPPKKIVILSPSEDKFEAQRERLSHRKFITPCRSGTVDRHRTVSASLFTAAWLQTVYDGHLWPVPEYRTIETKSFILHRVTWGLRREAVCVMHKNYLPLPWNREPSMLGDNRRGKVLGLEI